MAFEANLADGREESRSHALHSTDSLSSLFQSGLELESFTLIVERRPREPPQPLEDPERLRERQKQRDGAPETLQGIMDNS